MGSQWRWLQAQPDPRAQSAVSALRTPPVSPGSALGGSSPPEEASVRQLQTSRLGWKRPRLPLSPAARRSCRAQGGPRGGQFPPGVSSSAGGHPLFSEHLAPSMEVLALAASLPPGSGQGALARLSSLFFKASVPQSVNATPSSPENPSLWSPTPLAQWSSGCPEILRKCPGCAGPHGSPLQAPLGQSPHRVPWGGALVTQRCPALP